MVEAQDTIKKEGGSEAAGLQSPVLSAQDNAIATNRGKESQETVDANFPNTQIHDDTLPGHDTTGSGKELPRHDPKEMTADCFVKGQDLSGMGVDGTLYAYKDGEVLKLDNGVTITTKDGKTVVTNNGDAQIKSDVTENGTQTITYDDGTVVTIKDGRLHHVSQQHLKVSIDENGNPQLGSEKKTVAFIDLDKDGDLDAWPVRPMNKPDGRTPAGDNSNRKPVPPKGY